MVDRGPVADRDAGPQGPRGTPVRRVRIGIIGAGFWAVQFYLPYLAVTGSMLRRRMQGQWPRPDHGPYFSLGRFRRQRRIAG